MNEFVKKKVLTICMSRTEIEALKKRSTGHGPNSIFQIIETHGGGTICHPFFFHVRNTTVFYVLFYTWLLPYAHWSYVHIVIVR